MIHTRSSQTDKVLSALEELQLSDSENRIAQEYLDGEAGDEILKGLTPRNMTSCFVVRYRFFQELFTSCLSNKKYEEASRLLRLLYAIGAYSCCECFENVDTFMDAVERGYLDIDRARAVAVSAQHIFMQIYRLASNYRARLLTTRQLERLVMFADRNPEIILRAWKEFGDQQFSGRLLLMALYFFLRYDREGRSVGELPQGPDQALEQQPECQPGQELGLRSECQPEGELEPQPECQPGQEPGLRPECQPEGELEPQWECQPGQEPGLRPECQPEGELEPQWECEPGQQPERGIQGTAEDQALLKEYEEALTDLLGRIFKAAAAGKKELQDIQEGIRRGQFRDSLLSGVRNWAVDPAVFEVVINCAYINYTFSESLHNVLRVCGALNSSGFLSAVIRVDLRENIGNIAGKLEELFGISDQDVMSWLLVTLDGSPRFGISTEKVREKILPAQYHKNRELYLLSYKKADDQAGNALAGIIREEDPEMYQQIVMPKAASQRDRIIFRLTDKQICARECRDYLAGVTDLSALYAVRGKLIDTYGESSTRRALEQYYDAYRDEVFYARCMAYMALRGCRRFFNVGLIGDRTKAPGEVLEHTFQGLALAGLDMVDQIQVVCLMVEDEYVEEKKQSVAQSCVPVFQRYLIEKTQETENAFARAGAYGRYFALLVYGSEMGDEDKKIYDKTGSEPAGNRENRRETAKEPAENRRETAKEPAENQEETVDESAQDLNSPAAALAEFARGKDAWQAQILSYSQDSSKQVRQELERMLADRPGWRPQVTQLLSSKKASQREMGIRVLAGWNTTQDREILRALYEKEKNTKLRTLLDTVLGHGAGDGGTGEGGRGNGNPSLTREDLVKSLHKGGKKRSLAWAYETPFSPVHTKEGEQATEEYLQALLLCYSSMTKPGISKDAALLAENLDPRELAVYMGELFDKWMEAGAEARKRWVLFAAAIHGGSDIIQRLYHQIQEWPQNARGAIAADAVQALALNPQPQALLIVDGIARRFKFKQIKTAAGQALEFAASQLGLTREQLEDRIVPSLGFDEHMERHFDYGNRSFTVTITPALEVEVFDEKGKKLKNMPAPGARDQAEKAAAAYGEFKEMKKQMRTTISSQKQRLEMALSTERLWTVESWKELFVQNPIMHQFAIGLIWGIYQDHKLVQSFRYMEDGTFNTEEEEEYILPELRQEPQSKQGGIGLVHPIELSRESLENWKQQLEDYEVTQPIEQLNREVYYLTEEEQEGRSLERFGGMLINDLSLGGKLTAMGWYRGSVQDAGGFYTFYREDVSLGLGAELHFSGSFVGSGSMGGEEVTVYDVRFYEAGTIERGSYCCDEVEGEKQLPLKDIPPRYFSEIVWQLTKATASSRERDEEWKGKR